MPIELSSQAGAHAEGREINLFSNSSLNKDNTVKHICLLQTLLKLVFLQACVSVKRPAPSYLLLRSTKLRELTEDAGNDGGKFSQGVLKQACT